MTRCRLAASLRSLDGLINDCQLCHLKPHSLVSHELLREPLYLDPPGIQLKRPGMSKIGCRNDNADWQLEKNMFYLRNAICDGVVTAAFPSASTLQAQVVSTTVEHALPSGKEANEDAGEIDLLTRLQVLESHL